VTKGEKMLTQEQTKNFKEQLIRQIETSFPEDRKQFAISQIEAMNSEELEKFLIKNKLLKKGENSGQCVFCSIVSGDIKSYKLAENAEAIAVLEINPLSKGHTLIIPKEHISSEKQLPKQVYALSKKVSSTIKSRLKPKMIKIGASNVLGHEILNIVPVYNKDGKETGERHHASPEELDELQGILKKKSPVREVTRKTPRKIKKVEDLWLPKRIP